MKKESGPQSRNDDESGSKPESHYPVLDTPLLDALFEGRVEAVATPFYENERPLLGLAGKLDWRFEGVASEVLRAGAISGKAGECAYVPVHRGGRTYHWLLVGGGFLNPHSRRGLIPDESYRELKKNLQTLKLKSVGVSRKDLGGLQDDYLHRCLGEVPLWIAP